MTSNSELLQRRQNAVARGVYSATPIFAERAKNAELWDADGKRYIDFAVGIAVCNTGHCHPKIMAAAKQQCDLFTHTAFQVSAYETYIALAERLNELAPIEDAKSLFFSTGAIRGRLLKIRHWIDRAFGGLLVCFGAILATTNLSR